MLKLAFAGALALVCLALGGCSALTTLQEISGSSVSPTQVIVVANSFDAIEATATNYLKLPACPGTASQPVCRNQAAVNIIVPAIRSGRTARSQLEAYVTANPGQAAPVSGYNTLTTAISAIQNALAQYTSK